MKKITLVMSMSIILSCGPTTNDNNVPKETSGVEQANTEQRTEEFTVRAVGNTMAEMKFDIPNITVREGSKVKITLINEGSDPAMIHNIVFINYGTRKEIAMAAIEASSTKYIPNNNNVIAGSDLANPGETIVLEFDAPKKGNYEFLCTYPGHAEMMRGYFFVK